MKLFWVGTIIFKKHSTAPLNVDLTMIGGFSVLIWSSHDRLGSAGLANKLNASRLIRFRYSGRWACLWGGRLVCGGGGGRIKARSVQGCVSKKCMMLIFFFNPCTRSPVGVGSTRSEHTFLACTTEARFKYARPVLFYVLYLFVMRY